jgi:MFS family permease
MANTGDPSNISKPVWKDALFWFVIAAGLGYGGVRNFVPATFPLFHRDMDATLAQMGQTQFLFYLTGLVFATVGGPILVWLGLKRAAVAAFSLLALSLVLPGIARHFSLVLISSLITGFAVCALVVITSSAISSHFRAIRQSVFLVTGLSDAGGSMFGPAMLGWWFAHAGRWNLTWRSGYFIGAGVIGLLVLWALVVPSANMRGDKREKNTRWTGLKNMGAVLRNSAFFTAVILCFFHGSAQAGMISFVGQLFIKKLHIDAAHAAYLLSAEAIGILGGRALFSGITAIWKIPELMVIAACGAIETTAFVATALAPSYASGFVLFVTAGIFMSAIGPSLSSFLGGRLTDQVATAFALFAGLGNIGAALGPFIIGILGTGYGIEKAIFLSPLSGALLCSVALTQYLRERSGVAHLAKLYPIVTEPMRPVSGRTGT